MNSNFIVLTIILLVGCLPGVGSDIYTPSLPAIANDLNTHINNVQWSMAIYMFGMGITQLFFGPLSEGIGRRPAILLGLITLLTGCVISAFAQTISVLILARFIQGCGAGGCTALWRTVFRDSFDGPELSKYGSYLAVFISFIIPAAPTLGGYIQELVGWRASFYFMITYAVITILSVIILFKETHKTVDTKKLKMSFIIPTFLSLIKSRIFMGYTLCVFLCYGAFFAWFTASPVLLIEVIGITPVQYGWLSFFGTGISMLLSSFVNGRLVKKVGMPFMLKMGWTIMFAAGALMLSLKMIFGLNTYVIIGPMMLFFFGVTFIWSNAFASAFTPFGHIAGYAGALYGTMQISGGAVIGGLVSHLPDTNQIPLALIFMAAPVLAWLAFELIVSPERQ